MQHIVNTGFHRFIFLGLEFVVGNPPTSLPVFRGCLSTDSHILRRVSWAVVMVVLTGSFVFAQQTLRALRTVMSVSYTNSDYELGTGMIGLGDINNDGKPDFAVGARKIRKAFIYFGGQGILDSTTDLVIKGGDVMAGGDLNGDGIVDLVTSTELIGQDTLFVYFGRHAFPIAIDTIPDLTIPRETEGGGDPQFGRSFALGDINCDGFDDLIVGAPHYSSKGKVYVHLGRSVPKATPDFTVLGDSLGSSYGFTIKTGDINGDGAIDLAIGSNITVRSSNPYEHYALLDVYYGKPGWTFSKDKYDQRLDSRDGTRPDMYAFNLIDVNADGKSDISYGYGDKQYFIFGRSDSVSHSPDSCLMIPDTTFFAGFAGPGSSIGDINNDGRSDFAFRTAPYGGGVCLVVYLGSSWPQPIATRCKGFVGAAFYIIVPLGDVDENGVNDFGTTAPFDALGSPPQDGYFVVLSGDASFVTSVNSEASVLSESLLSQNYPNPFNPNTTIEYTLPRSGHVLLIIYDSMGKEVRTLVDESQRVGFHRILWDGSTTHGDPVASGAYFYRVVVDGVQMGTKKSLLTK